MKMYKPTPPIKPDRKRFEEHSFTIVLTFDLDDYGVLSNTELVNILTKYPTAHFAVERDYEQGLTVYINEPFASDKLDEKFDEAMKKYDEQMILHKKELLKYNNKIKDGKEAKDVAEYERLKAKFGDPNV